MKNYEKALNKFLKELRKEPWYEGTILTGSYAVGNNDQNSDVDIFIVTSNNLDWRERGNKLVDGFLIEYFMNPVFQIEKYFDREKNSVQCHTIRMFENGKIIDDQNGEVKNLQDLAIKLSKNQKFEVSDYDFNMSLYSHWDKFDELDSKYKKGENIDLMYYIYLQSAFNCYCECSKTGGFPLAKLERVLSDENYRKNYNIKKMPEKKFLELLKNCLTAKEREEKYQNAKKLYEFIVKKFKFDINNFVLRTPAKKD